MTQPPPAIHVDEDSERFGRTRHGFSDFFGCQVTRNMNFRAIFSLTHFHSCHLGLGLSAHAVALTGLTIFNHGEDFFCFYRLVDMHGDPFRRFLDGTDIFDGAMRIPRHPATQSIGIRPLIPR